VLTTERPAVERVQPPKRLFVVINRLVRWRLASPPRAARLGRHLLLLHLTGRSSDRQLDVPVGYRELPDGRLLVLTNSVWRHNLRGRPAVEVTLRGARRGAHAELVEDPGTVATVYAAVIAEMGRDKAGRRLGIRIRVDRDPTHEELLDAVRRSGLALAYLSVAPQ
jgi:F420H(2)-dependent quinone reductase